MFRRTAAGNTDTNSPAHNRIEPPCNDNNFSDWGYYNINNNNGHSDANRQTNRQTNYCYDNNFSDWGYYNSNTNNGHSEANSQTKRQTNYCVELSSGYGGMWSVDSMR